MPGPDAGGLSASTVARLTEVWADQHAHWLKRDLSARHYVYFWADGIHVQARLEDDAQCLLVIIGATPEGKKELAGLIDGVRESAQSWRELLLDLKRRGLAVAPELAIADGALGFWKAIEEVWPRTRSQRCWVHKTANVLNKLPKSQHSKAKRALQEIWMAETRNHADSAFDAFIETYAVKYDKAAACLVKDRATMLAFPPAHHQESGGAFGGARCRGPERVRTVPIPKPEHAMRTSETLLLDFIRQSPQFRMAVPSSDAVGPLEFPEIDHDRRHIEACQP